MTPEVSPRPQHIIRPSGAEDASSAQGIPEAPTFIPQEVLSDPRVLAQEALRTWHARRPHYPTDAQEEERRHNLLRQDPTYQALAQRYHDPTASEEERDRLYEELHARWRGSMTGPPA